MNARRFLVLASAYLVIVLPSHVAARVYWLGGRDETGGMLTADPAWTRAYATMLKLNGGRAGLEVWNAGLGIADAAGEVRKRALAEGGAFWLTGEGDMAWGIGYVGDRVIRMLFVAGEGPRQCLVYQLSQSIEEFQAALRPPDRHLMKSIPPYPGGQPVSYIGSETTGLEMATSRAGTDAAAAQSFYARELPSTGWAPVFNPGKGADIYLRDREMLLVAAKSTGETGGCLLMVLRKPLSSGNAR